MKIIETHEQVVVEPEAAAANASVIWLHGLGADGHDFVPLARQLELPDDVVIRFIFPNAPMQPVTINQGMVMPAWYDIVAIEPGAQQDAPGIEASSQRLRELVDQQQANGIASDRIILAGFSQGGVIAVHAALRYPKPLAGIIALSTYLALPDSLAAELETCQRTTPVLWAHGDADPVVPLDYAYLGYQQLAELGLAVTWRQYPMAHEVCLQELTDINRFLVEQLASN